MASVTEKSNPVPLIIFIVLFVFSSVALALVSVEYAKLRNYVEQGFKPGPEDHRLDLLSAGLKSRYQALNSKYQESLDELGQYKAVVGVVKVDKLKEEMKNFAGRVTVVQEGEGEAPNLDGQNLMQLMHTMEMEKIILTDRYHKSEGEFKKQVEQMKNDVEIERRSAQEAQARAQQKSTELDEIKAAQEKALAEKTQLLDDLKKKNEMERASHAAEVEKINKERGDMEADKNNYKEMYEELVRKSETKESRPGESSDKDAPAYVEPADGKIIKVDKDAGIIVDIGQKKGVRRGFRFQVYYEKPDGTRITRGEIEIKTVFPDIARGILVGGQDPTDVVHTGDIIVNVAFDPGRAKVFVADDIFDEAKVASFKQMLAEYGSVLEDDISPRTNYLIIGSQSGKRRDVAVKQGVILIQDSELRRYLGR